jgi:nucleoside-diphosphate-sugar epimerase
MKKVVVTGGSGKAGCAVVKDLVAHGYEVLSIDLSPPHERVTRHLKVDLTDLGQVCEALSGAEAVVHLGAIPGPGIVTGEVTFRTNIASTYNVFSAATLLKLQRVVWASSIRTMGFPLAPGAQPDYVPIDEEHPLYPGCTYGLSKVLNEEMARQFNRWSGIPFIGFRYSRILEAHEYQDSFSGEQGLWFTRSELWSYVDVQDVAQSCRLGLEAAIQGAEVFIITAADIALSQPASELMRQHFPTVPQREVLADNASLFSIKKAQTLLGYTPQHSWRKYG